MALAGLKPLTMGGEAIRSFNAAGQQFNRDEETYISCLQTVRQAYQADVQKYLKCRLGKPSGACPTPLRRASTNKRPRE